MADMGSTESAIRASANRCRGLADDARRVSSQLATEMAELESKWEGDDHRVYADKVNNKMNVINRLANAFDNHAAKLDNIATIQRQEAEEEERRARELAEKARNARNTRSY